MKEDAPFEKQTSRRQFTKAIVTAAVAVPIVATVACKTESQPAQSGSPQSTPAAAFGGPKIKSCDAGIPFEDHIPPMGIDGGGSLRIEMQNKFVLPGGGRPPFTYVERAPLAPFERYGMLDKVRVITELVPPAPGTTNALITDVTYSLLPQDSELFLWYQPLPGTSDPGEEDPDSTFPSPPPPYPDNDPDFRLRGGRGANFMRIIVKYSKLARNFEHTHRLGRPFRYKHESNRNIPGLGRHFRIGKWRIVDGNGNVVMDTSTTPPRRFEASGDEEYRLYAFFKHYA